MSAIEPSMLANSIVARIYDVLTSGDDTVPKSEDNFFSWCTPGIPVDSKDFEFLTQGFTGVVKKAALDEMRSVTEGPAGDQAGEQSGEPKTSQPELTPELLERLRAQDSARLYMQAENFARLVDFVPDLASLSNNQFARLSVMNNEGTLSDRYEYILRMSQVMQSELPAKTKEKIEKFRKLLTVTKTKINLIDDSVTEVTVPSPMVEMYNEKLKAYEDAALEYNARRIDALAADNSKAVHYWAMNANILRNRVKNAMMDWVNSGYKNDYEQIAAFIDQVMQRDMAMLKQQYRDDLEKARLTGLASGSDFYYTAVVPGNFLNTAGWTNFTFSASDFNRYRNSSYNYSQSVTRGGGGGIFGFFGIGGSGSSSNSSGQSQTHVSFNSEHFSMGFKIAQVPIVRPWLKTAFLMSKAWRFDQNNPESKGEMVSDGGKPAKGLIPAYPTTLIMIKDLWLSLSKSSGFEDLLRSYESSSASGGGFLSLGPFHLGGSHAQSSGSGRRSSSYHYDSATQTMNVPGAQVIGYKCHIFPKSPDPLATITNWV